MESIKRDNYLGLLRHVYILNKIVDSSIGIDMV